jgi:hypothetical protein
MVDEIKTTESDRTPRSAESRDKVSRRKPWQPPSLLDAPPPPQGCIQMDTRINDRAERPSEYVKTYS